MGTNQQSDLHFVVQRGDRSLDADLASVHGLTSHDIITAVVAGVSGAVATDTIWGAADDLVRGTGSATAERFAVAASRIIGKAASGKVRDLTAAEAKAILALVAADVSDFNTAVRTSTVNQLASPTTAFDMNGQKVTNAGTPTVSTDLTTKAYVDAVGAAGQQVKSAAATSTTANITLSGEQTIDGVLTSASTVLVKNQSTASQNGIYVSASGAWSRASDSDTGAKLVNAYVNVTGGTAGAGKSWQQVTPATITIGSTSIVWNQYSSMAGGDWSVVSVSTNTTAANRQVLLVDATSGAITITVPNTANLICIVAKSDASANTVTITASAGGVDGDVEILTGQYQARMMVGTGADVRVVGERKPFGSPARLGGPSAAGTSSSISRTDHVHDTKITVNTQTVSYTLVLTDADNKTVEINNAGATTLTIPPSASVAWVAGTTIEVYQMGAGQTTVTAGVGVTLRAPNGAKTAAQYSTVGLRYRGSNEWVLSGDTSV